MFRNLTFFRFPVALAALFAPRDADDGIAFEVTAPVALEGITENQAKPVGPSQLSSRGFVPPLGSASEELLHAVGDCIWLTVGGEDRILPAAAVNRELAKRVAEIEEREGRRPGGRARKRLKDDIVAELLSRALVKQYRCDGYLDLQRGFVAVDTAGRKAAENFVSEIRFALGSFVALPLNAETAVRALLTLWLAGETLPPGFLLGDSCTLQDPVSGGGAVRCVRQPLEADEIRHLLDSGKQCTRLAMVFDDLVSFELGEDLVLRKVRLLEAAVEALENQERDSIAAELDARFALFSGEIGRLFDALEPVLKLSKAEG